MKRTRLLAATAAVLAVASATIFATNLNNNDQRAVSHVQQVSLDHKTYSTPKELKDDSDVVIRGTVLDGGKTIAQPPLKAEDGTEVQNTPFTEFQVAVKKIFKGSVPGDQITVVLTGGVQGDTRFEAQDMPWLSKRDNAIMYLHLGGDGKYYPMAGGAALAKEKPGKSNTFTLPAEVSGKQDIDLSESSL